MTRQAEWTPEAIERFWNYRSTRKHRQGEYFSYQVGAGVANFLEWTGRLSGPLLDYGAGPGYLINRFLERNIRSAAADLSEDAVQAMNKRMADHPHWMGSVAVHPDGKTRFEDGTFSVVTCVETLEHLSEDLIRDVLTEIRRLLAPGGIALFTTPNSEELESNLVYCPFCETEFHPIQHLQSFDPLALERILKINGFETIFVSGLDFHAFQRHFPPSWKDMSPRLAVETLRRLRARAADRLSPRDFPEQRELRFLLGQGEHHLAAIARPA